MSGLQPIVVDRVCSGFKFQLVLYCIVVTRLALDCHQWSQIYYILYFNVSHLGSADRIEDNDPGSDRYCETKYSWPGLTQITILKKGSVSFDQAIT